MDSDLFTYAQRYTTSEAEILNRLSRETHLTQVYPQMLAGHMQGLLLHMISHMISPKRVLEIGTFTGYSAICLAAGLCNQASEASPPSSGLLHTIEVNPELETTIRKYLKEASLEHSVRLHIGDAREIIPTLNEQWDLVFIDADKSSYLEYYHLLFPSVRPGGFILADNVLWDGKVIDTTGNIDRDTKGIMEFNAFIQQDNRVEQLLLPFRDGLMIIRKLG